MADDKEVKQQETEIKKASQKVNELSEEDLETTAGGASILPRKTWD